MPDKKLELSPGGVSLRQLRRIYFDGEVAQLTSKAKSAARGARKQVEAIASREDAVYGINTGFGLLARERIPHERLAELQRNLVLSHSTGTGADLAEELVRLVIALKLVGLGRGHSGVRGAILDQLEQILESGWSPCIPSKGSVGASGDLAPLAHLAATLVGEGEFRRGDERIGAMEFHSRQGASPLELAPKEGLALINGTQVSSALAIGALLKLERVFAAAVTAGALSVDAAKGSDRPFDARVHEARGQVGQMAVASVYRDLLAGSAIRASHADCNRVQDPYSLRCQPQVMGACLDSMSHAARVLEIEANAVTDNPILFPGDDDVISGGNFHAEPVAQVADLLAIATAEIGNISERRTALLVDPNMSGLPAFLVEDGGVNSGFMIAQVTAAALASENKALAHPSSVDTIPTSANQEDHVSMATYAARRLHAMAENAADIVAIELLAAAQGLEFHRPIESSKALESTVAKIRARVPRYERDRYFAPDIQAVKELVVAGEFLEGTMKLLPSYASAQDR